MKAEFKLVNPDEMEASATITMNIAGWKRLRAELNHTWPAWDLSQAIDDVVRQAEARFTHSQENTNG